MKDHNPFHTDIHEFSRSRYIYKDFYFPTQSNIENTIIILQAQKIIQQIIRESNYVHWTKQLSRSELHEKMYKCKGITLLLIWQILAHFDQKIIYMLNNCWQNHQCAQFIFTQNTPVFFFVCGGGALTLPLKRLLWWSHSQEWLRCNLWYT